jgi:hypothetical protein
MGNAIMEWIKCADRLPENRQIVLIYTRDKRITLGEFLNEETWFTEPDEILWWVVQDLKNPKDEYGGHESMEAHEVKYWMPLPQPPE